MLAEKLLSAAVGKLGAAAAVLVPDWWKRRALAELRDRNPFARIAPSDDLLRAVRLAWIEAALDVTKAAAGSSESRASPGGTDETRRFADLARCELRRVRAAAIDMTRHPGPSPIDAHAQAIVGGVVATAPEGEPGAAIGAGFVATLAALTGWPAAEVPTPFEQVAAAGLATTDGPSRRFGELVLAAFAAILTNPKRYPEARQAFRIAMERAARDLAEATFAAVRGIDAKVDEALARLDRLTVAQDGLERYRALVPEIAGGVGRIAEQTARIEAKVDALLATDRGRSVAEEAGARGLSGETLRAVMLRLWAEGLGRDDIIAELERWLAKYLEERARGVNEDAAFQAALAEARRRVEAGRIDEASAAFMDEFAREETEETERQEERRRRRLRLLEEAVRFDELALDGRPPPGSCG